MIATGDNAPGFSLEDRFDLTINLDPFKGHGQVMLSFYPLDLTPD